MPTHHGREDIAMGKRMDLSCAAVGLVPPPGHVSLKFRPIKDRWRVVALTTPDKVIAVAQWLQTYHPVSVQMGPGLAPKVVRAEFAVLPERWANVVSSVRLHHIECSPTGIASLFIAGTKDQVDYLLAQGSPDETQIRTRSSMVQHNHVKIRPRQLEAVRTAVAMGYYEIPHRLDLRELAAKMGLSLGSFSELLRRGESAIVNGFADAMAASQWEQLDDAAANPIPDVSAPVNVTRTSGSTTVLLPATGRFDPRRSATSGTPMIHAP